MANHHKGYITSSTVGKLLTGKGNKLLKGGRKFARQLAMERFGVEDNESYFDGNSATEWGNEHEIVAIDRYEMETFETVYGMQEGVTAKLEDGKIVQTSDDEGWLSCTPDGYVNEDGLAEVKCHHSSQKHMMNLLEDQWVKKYEEQCRFQMMLTDRDWCDLISYDPRWPEPMDLHYVRLERDPEWEAFCMDRIEQAEKIIAETLEKLNQL